MKATVDYVQRKFEEFNQLMFGGQLPPLPIVLTDEARALGKCCYLERRLPDGRKVYDHFSLKINTRIDLPEAVLEDTIIHEMIHYFLLRHNLNDTAPHGPLFRAVMQSINSTHGRKVAVSHKLSAEERAQAASTRAKWHVVAAVYFHSGQVGVKVLPRTIQRVVGYYAQVSSAAEVARVELYLHNNPFFNRYPTSSALHIHPIDRELLEANLIQARRLQVRGNQLLELH